MKVLRTQHPAALALLAGAALAALVPGAAAVALDSPPQGAGIDVRSATLVSKGLAVDVTVAYTCPVGSYAYDLEVSVRQRSGSEVTSGSTTTNPGTACTGTEQQSTVRVFAGGGMRIFKRGDALVTASLDYYGYQYGTVTTQEEVTVTR